MANEVPPSGWCDVPTVAAIGWIPYYLRLADLLEDVPDNAYAATRPIAYDLLFDSGNKDPDNDLGPDGEKFWEIVKSLDYRGALFLDGLRVYFGPSGMDLDRESERKLARPGYTPVREWWCRKPEQPGVSGLSPAEEQQKRDFYLLPKLPGVGGGDLKIEREPSRITITQRVDFRLCKMIEVAGGFINFNFRGAPYAWMEMTMIIRRDGIYRIEFSGSAFPSQRLYINWQNCDGCSYDMLKSSHAEMEGFFHAGRQMYVGKAVRAPRREDAPLIHEDRLC